MVELIKIHVSSLHNLCKYYNILVAVVGGDIEESRTF